LDLVSKGVDNQFNVQPSEVLPYFNARGVVVNNWYHVPVIVDPRQSFNYIQRVTELDRLNPPTGGHCINPWNQHGWTSPEAGWHEEIMREHRAKQTASSN
jgi:hypothetical protein